MPYRRRAEGRRKGEGLASCRRDWMSQERPNPSFGRRIVSLGVVFALSEPVEVIGRYIVRLTSTTQKCGLDNERGLHAPFREHTLIVDGKRQRRGWCANRGADHRSDASFESAHPTMVAGAADELCALVERGQSPPRATRRIYADAKRGRREIALHPSRKHVFTGCCLPPQNRQARAICSLDRTWDQCDLTRALRAQRSVYRLSKTPQRNIVTRQL